MRYPSKMRTIHVLLGSVLIAQTFVIMTSAAYEAPRRYPTVSNSVHRLPMTSSPAEQAAIFREMIAYRDKRASNNKAEPTCEELRAMWIYSKRQSRAAETTNDLPMYRDPFAHNVWDTYPIRSPSNPIGYRDSNGGGQVRNRGAGGAIYGKVVHKAPAGSRLRNGMPNRINAFEEVSRMYGTINRQVPDPRRRQTSFRIGGGGGGSPMSEVPQAGRFQHLKDILRTERVRELQEQRDAEEIAARAAVLKEIANGERRVSHQQESRRQFMNSVQPYQEPKGVNYGYGQSQYVPSFANFDGGLLSGDKYDRNTMLHK